MFDRTRGNCREVFFRRGPFAPRSRRFCLKRLSSEQKQWKMAGYKSRMREERGGTSISIEQKLDSYGLDKLQGKPSFHFADARREWLLSRGQTGEKRWLHNRHIIKEFLTPNFNIKWYSLWASDFSEFSISNLKGTPDWGKRQARSKRNNSRNNKKKKQKKSEKSSHRTRSNNSFQIYSIDDRCVEGGKKFGMFQRVECHAACHRYRMDRFHWSKRDRSR